MMYVGAPEFITYEIIFRRRPCLSINLYCVGAPEFIQYELICCGRPWIQSGSADCVVRVTRESGSRVNTQ